MKKVTVANLKPCTGPGPHPLLHCQLCGSEYSAHAGDYGTWNGFASDHVFRCCKRPMRLVFKQTLYVDASV